MNEVSGSRPTTKKAERHNVILQLIKNQPVNSQEQLVQLLAAEGIGVTQTTLSRDLAELKVLKGADRYVVQQSVVQESTASDHPPVGAIENPLQKAVREHVVSVDIAMNLVVLKTEAGHAQPVGLALDNFPDPLVVGNISGDDTIFVATRSEKEAAMLMQKINSWIN